ncbi:MAG: flagellar filament capping protein FliD [FCB group bacterium]|nr:flagellar filament capping protein FliD [FCB group bacterium]
MAIDLTSIYSNQNSIEYLVQQYMQIESRPRNKLARQRDLLNSKSQVLSELDSKLSALKTKVDRLTDPITNYFATKLATGSNSDLFTVTAATSTNLGNHSLSVERLATSDTRVSQQYTDTGTLLASAFSTDQTFSIEVAHPTDADAANRVSISVTINAADFSGNDDNTVLDAIRDAINTAMSDAVAAGTIDNDEVAHASVISEQNGKSRLVLRANQSGYTNRLDFSNSTLLQTLEISSASQSTGTAGGYITVVGTDETTSMLNSKFNIDGLDFYRDTNNITDAIDGLTIHLLDTFATTETITITPDTEAVKSEIQGFLDAYNDVISNLKTNAQINPDTYERGVLADDIVYRGIASSLRDIISSEVDITSSALYKHLYKIGIEADSSGKLSFTSTDDFTTALETNSQYVSDIFNATDGSSSTTDGIAVAIKDFIDGFVAVGGTIDSSKDNLDANIRNLDDRISSMDDLLSLRENQLRSQFSEMQAMMAKLANQMSFFGRFSTQY